MAKAYLPPKEIKKPVSDYSKGWEYILEQEKEYIREIADYCKKVSLKDKYAGDVISFPMADGKAVYVVLRSKPCELILVDTGDAWDLPEYAMRGINITEIKRQREIRKIFGRYLEDR